MLLALPVVIGLSSTFIWLASPVAPSCWRSHLTASSIAFLRQATADGELEPCTRRPPDGGGAGIVRRSGDCCVSHGTSGRSAGRVRLGGTGGFAPSIGRPLNRNWPSPIG